MRIVKAAKGARALVLALGLGGLAYAAHAESNPRTGFFNIFPSRPQLRLPQLGDVQAWKSDMQKARQAYREGDYTTARVYLDKALKNGNFLAAWYLGHIYRLGLGVPADPAMAFKYYRTVALQYDEGEPDRRVFLITLDAVVQVANGYRVGKKTGGVARNPARAYRLFASAARQGHPAAQYGLGLMFINGEGVKKNSRHGLKWINYSAQKNYPPALAYLGELFWKGKYVKKNRVRSVAFYMVAARSAREEAYPQIFDRLDQLSVQLDEKLYNRSRKLARAWLKTHPVRSSYGLINIPR